MLSLRKAQATLAASVVLSALTVWGVHHLQLQERHTMYQGVLRDDERRKEKARQREADFAESLQKRELYERVQPISSSGQ